MRLTVGGVLDQLVAEGLAPAEAVGRARTALEGAADTGPPWYARVIAGLAAWVATGCVIGFLVFSDIVDDEAEAMLAGAILLTGAVLLRRAAGRDEEFKRQLALAVSLAGQVLLIVGVTSETDSATAGGLVAVAISLVLIPVVADQAHRFMSALIGAIGAIGAMAGLKLAWTLGSIDPFGAVVVRGSDLGALAVVAAAAYVWRVDLRDRPQGRAEMLGPVGYGLVVALFGVLLFSSLFALADDVARGSRSAGLNAWHLGPGTTVGITAALIALEFTIFKEQRHHASPRREALVVAVGTTVLLGAVTLSTPGVVAAVAALALGFDRRDRFLVGLAVAFLVKFASVYYYSLHLTLLEKSMVLAASGLLVLAARGYLQLRFGPREAGA